MKIVLFVFGYFLSVQGGKLERKKKKQQLRVLNKWRDWWILDFTGIHNSEILYDMKHLQIKTPIVERTSGFLVHWVNSDLAEFGRQLRMKRNSNERVMDLCVICFPCWTSKCWENIGQNKTRHHRESQGKQNKTIENERQQQQQHKLLKEQNKSHRIRFLPLSASIFNL